MLSQRQRILSAIQRSGEDGVSNHKLAEIALNYTMRISELRKDGYDVRKARVYRNGKGSQTFVYYIPIKRVKKPTILGWLKG